MALQTSEKSYGDPFSNMHGFVHHAFVPRSMPPLYSAADGKAFDPARFAPLRPEYGKAVHRIPLQIGDNNCKSPFDAARIPPQQIRDECKPFSVPRITQHHPDTKPFDVTGMPNTPLLADNGKTFNVLRPSNATPSRSDEAKPYQVPPIDDDSRKAFEPPRVISSTHHTEHVKPFDGHSASAKSFDVQRITNTPLHSLHSNNSQSYDETRAPSAPLYVGNKTFEASRSSSTPLQIETDIKPFETQRRTPLRTDIVKPHKCEYCPAAFTQKTSLIIHIRGHTGEKPYKCEYCDAAFAYKQGLRLHTRTHTGEKPYECEYCGAAFTQKNSLVIHIRGHTGEKPFKCTMCDSAFTYKQGLRLHIRTHTGEKPYKCDYCTAAFTQRSSLVIHVRGHTGEKPYKCETCEAAFTVKRRLRLHSRTHGGDKPYKCGECGVAFSITCQVSNHNRVQPEKRTFKCDDCGAFFGSRVSLHNHTSEHCAARIPPKCEQCAGAFSGGTSMAQNARLHSRAKP